MKAIIKIEQPTVNRGIKLFTISTNGKGYFAHEIGKELELNAIVGGNERYAHRINKSMRYGNQFIRSWKPKPFASIDAAITAIQQQANANIIFC